MTSAGKHTEVHWDKIVDVCHNLNGIHTVKYMLDEKYKDPRARAVWLGCYFMDAIAGKNYTEPYEGRNHYETIKYLVEFYLNRAEFFDIDPATFRSVIDEATRTWKMPQIVELENGDFRIPDEKLHQE